MTLHNNMGKNNGISFHKQKIRLFECMFLNKNLNQPKHAEYKIHCGFLNHFNMELFSDTNLAMTIIYMRKPRNCTEILTFKQMKT